MYKVFVKLDGDKIIAINSSAFLADSSGWVQIDEGDGDKFHHAQGNYLPGALVDENGVHRFKLVDGVVTERTEAEIQADIAALPPAPVDPLRTVFRVLAHANVLTSEQALENQAMFEDWADRIGTVVDTGEYLRYEGLYRVKQSHTPQAHQPPSVHTAALYTRVQEPGAGPEPWVQGQSYAKGVEVSHKGGTWLSGVDNNVWEPGSVGVYDSIWKRVIG